MISVKSREWVNFLQSMEEHVVPTFLPSFCQGKLLDLMCMFSGCKAMKTPF
jgi:hypothetical protein